LAAPDFFEGDMADIQCRTWRSEEREVKDTEAFKNWPRFDGAATWSKLSPEQQAETEGGNAGQVDGGADGR
jgi:hypothetical protein